MAKISLVEQTTLRAFTAVMSMDRSTTNIRRAEKEVNSCLAVSTMIHRENNKHMYDKKIYKGAGEFLMDDAKAVISRDVTDIRGPVTVNIINVPKRTRNPREVTA